MNKGLDRFIIAQQNYYRTALSELKAGKKRSHWMWFIFPQIRGLGFSEMAKYYAIQNKEEAVDFVTDQTLGRNLIELSQVLLELETNDPGEVFGDPDDKKLWSCMTLFAIVAPEIDIFEKVLEKYFSGNKDLRTIELLQELEQ